MAASNTSEFDIDKIIERLLDVKTSKPNLGKQVNLTENEIKALCVAAERDFY